MDNFALPCFGMLCWLHGIYTHSCIVSDCSLKVRDVPSVSHDKEALSYALHWPSFGRCEVTVLIFIMLPAF